MKRIKKWISIFTVVALMLSMIQTNISIKANSIDAYKAQLIMYYQTYQDAAQNDIDRILAEMSAIDEKEAKAWDEIMDYWSTVNQAGFVNVEGIPSDLPQDQSLAIVILGFALNDDGTMKEELIGRLQKGLDIANAYPNAYVAVTGGGTAANNTEVTEGGLMGEWLIEQGLDESRLIIENRAADTVGNATNTYTILNEQYPSVDSIVLVTSDYHVPRGCLLYNSQFILKALENNSESITIIANGGYDTNSDKTETIELQANGLRSVAGISEKPTVTLSVLKGIKVTQNTPYTTGAALDLTIEALYDNGHTKDISEFVTIENFDASLDANQDITLTYIENDITINGTFNLTLTSKCILDTEAMETLITQSEALNSNTYFKTSYNYFLSVVNKAKEALNDPTLTLDRLNTMYIQLKNTKDSLRKKVNIASKATVTSNDQGSDNINKIKDNNKGTYWESGSTPYIEDLEINFTLDKAYTLEEIVVRPYYLSSEGTQHRSYFYDVYVSENNEDWTLVASHTATGTTDAGNSHPVDVDFNVKYIKIDGTGKINPPNQTNQKFHLSEVYIYGDDMNNILYNKPITSSGEDLRYETSATAVTGKALDNDASTYWDAGGYAKKPWIDIDLEDVYRLNSFKVINLNATNRYYHFDVYASIDGINYVKIAAKTDNTVAGGTGTTFQFDEIVCAKHIRVVGTYNSKNSAFHIAEMCAYGQLATEDEINESNADVIKAPLQALVKKYYRSDYTAASWAEYANVREEAYALLEAVSPSPESVEDIMIRLEAAASKLVEGNPDERIDGAFRLASFNIWAPNPDRPNTAAINEEILRVEPDFVGVQEVDKNNDRNNNDVLKLIADDDFYYHYHKTINYKNGQYGIGLLSTYEMKETSGANYKKIGSEEGRGWTRMLVEFEGRDIAIYNTHISLTSNGSNTAQLSNMNELIAVLENDPIPYKLVTGDYNATREAMDPFKENYNLANGNDGLWYPTYILESTKDAYDFVNGTASADYHQGIDNIVYTRNLKLENFRVVYNDDLSDHLMIYGDFSFLTYDEDLQAYVNEHTYQENEVVSGWSTYATALEVANTLLANEKVNVMQDECKESLENLKAAVEALQFSGDDKQLVAEVLNYKSAQLKWSQNQDAKSYVIERFNTNTNEWMKVAETTESSYQASKLKTGKTYTYRIKSMNEQGEEIDCSDEINVTTALDGQIELILAKNDQNQFELQWSSVEGATRYIIYRQANDGAWKKVLTLGKDATTYTSKTMKPGTYAYQVKAARYDGNERVMSEGSNVVEGIVDAASLIPTNVTVEQNKGTITLKWDAVTGMKGYEVYRSKDNGAYRHIKRTSATTITSTSLKTGSTYQYKIKAFTTVNGEKVYSAEVETQAITIR